MTLDAGAIPSEALFVVAASFRSLCAFAWLVSATDDKEDGQNHDTLLAGFSRAKNIWGSQVGITPWIEKGT